jgi:hypothetical protein
MPNSYNEYDTVILLTGPKIKDAKNTLRMKNKS